MSRSIIIRPHPFSEACSDRLSGDPTRHMPMHSRMRVAGEINKAWAEFVTDMHDGPTTGPEVADKFWKFVTGT